MPTDPAHPACPDDPIRDVTRLLDDLAAGRAESADKLLALVYGHLRRVAQKQLGGERRGHSLQATELVHEAYLKLLGGLPGRSFNGREHFYNTVAEAMRRVLIDYSRQRGRVKRGGDRQRLPIADVASLAEDGKTEEIVAIDDAIRRLEEMDPRIGRMVRLRFFAGLSVDETSVVLGTSVRTVMRDWDFARTWLYREFKKEEDG